MAKASRVISPIEQQAVKQVQDGKTLFAVALLQVFSFWGVAPLWLSVFVTILVLAVRYLSWVKLPWGRRLVVVTGSIWLFLYYGAQLTVEMAACFLWLALSFKLLEIKSRRDLLTYVYTVFYLCAASLLFNQSLIQLLCQLVIIVSALYILLKLNGGSLEGLKGQWSSVAKVMAFAIPLVVVLFLFFPRIAPLWTIPVKGSQAQTGLSDSMTPGDIASLVNSDERAFRVTFPGEIPPQNQLYWRGVVLDKFDGRTWSRTESVSRRFAKYDQGVDARSDAEFYEVLLEPHNQKWLFSLAGSIPLSSHVLPGDMGLYELAVEALQPVRYRMTQQGNEVSLDAAVNAIPTAAKVPDGSRIQTNRRRDLFVPLESNKGTQLYVRELLAQSPDQVSFVTELMQRFRTEAFTYTLEPPLYGDNFVDEFLFGDRRGFCAHYSGSLAYMLRLAGIPARVVIGYQGGERINNGEYLLVRQYDAHAWVEARIEGMGWVRLDPTAMVAPDRVENNLQQAMSEEGSFLADNTAALLRNSVPILAWLSLKADQINFEWQKWVVNYSRGKQMNFFQQLFGNTSLANVVYVLIGAFTVVSFFAILYLSLSGTRSVDRTRAQKRYLFSLWLVSLIGYRRDVGESPRSFVSRMEQNAPGWLSSHVKRVTKRFEASEYQHGA